MHDCSHRTSTISVDCRICLRETELRVEPKDFTNWYNGTLIQDAFPYLTPDEQELLISSTCGTCFDKLFGEDEE